MCKEEGDFLRHQLSHSCSFSLSQKFSYSMAALEETPTAPDPIATTSGSGANNNSSNNSSRPSTGSSSKISISLPATPAPHTSKISTASANFKNDFMTFNTVSSKKIYISGRLFNRFTMNLFTKPKYLLINNF